MDTNINDYVIDPGLAGLSGDMFISAFADLAGEDIRKAFNSFVKAILDEFNLTESVFEVNRAVINGIKGCQVNQKIVKDLEKRDFSSIRGYFLRVYDLNLLTERAVDFCRKILDIIITAEANVHGKEVNDNKGHFHELGSIDTVIDICGVAYLLDQLDGWNSEFVVLPVNTGSGTVKIAHGVVNIPVPAVTEILCREKIPFFSDGTKAELVTPTGAALLAGLKTKLSTTFPLIEPDRYGNGHGSRKTERMNYLRILTGNLLEKESSLTSRLDEITVLETHVDDISGEILGTIFERLITAGALDVAVFPFVTKKNRPGSCLKVISSTDRAERLANIMFKHLRTLGIRCQLSKRFILPRTVVSEVVVVNDKEYTVSVKIAGQKDDPVFSKIEFDDLQIIAIESGLSIQDVREIINRQL
ncbi:MAG: nickel pincer cofactor biosynthesis protein LarC [Candidatus Hodarchaeales archaeon]